MSEALQANAHLVHHVGDMVMATVAVVPADATRKDVLAAEAEASGAPEYYVLVEAGQVVGIVGRETAHGDAVDAAPLAHLARSDFVVVVGDTTLFELVATMHRRTAGVAVVRTTAAAGAGLVVAGIVTGTAVAEAIAEGMEMFSD
jgi:hypothetical protein